MNALDYKQLINKEEAEWWVDLWIMNKLMRR